MGWPSSKMGLEAYERHYRAHSSGTGKGIDLGVTFGEFVITKQSAKKARK
jgi:hypothetical protein